MTEADDRPAGIVLVRMEIIVDHAFSSDSTAEKPVQADARPLSTVELLQALHSKFSINFSQSQPSLPLADHVERQARMLSDVAEQLRCEAGQSNHQSALAGYLDEIFGDCMCALYLASCGLCVPAQMLLRRALELGLTVVAYWDSPVDFWKWREHDGDIRFTELCSYLEAPAYTTFLRHQRNGATVDLRPPLSELFPLYRDLSNVVHPKPRNFTTKPGGGYSFKHEEFVRTVQLSENVYQVLLNLMIERFPHLVTNQGRKD
ncbi:hypothetical protein FBQ96_01875 [Nitrospirales bacterium NOB]|nr:hypothetical protein [Nitrospirales bacterium NOB]